MSASRPGFVVAAVRHAAVMVGIAFGCGCGWITAGSPAGQLFSPGAWEACMVPRSGCAVPPGSPDATDPKRLCPPRPAVLGALDVGLFRARSAFTAPLVQSVLCPDAPDQCHVKASHTQFVLTRAGAGSARVSGHLTLVERQALVDRAKNLAATLDIQDYEYGEPEVWTMLGTGPGASVPMAHVVSFTRTVLGIPLGSSILSIAFSGPTGNERVVEAVAQWPALAPLGTHSLVTTASSAAIRTATEARIAATYPDAVPPKFVCNLPVGFGYDEREDLDPDRVRLQLEAITTLTPKPPPPGAPREKTRVVETDIPAALP